MSDPSDDLESGPPVDEAGAMAKDLATDPPVRTKQPAGRSVLAAAMIGLGQVLEPEKFEDDIQIEAPADDDRDDPLKNISFGNLPPLD